jgi:hypothetical protein
MANKRTWVGFDEDSFTTPELDSSNLPVKEQPKIDSDIMKDTTGDGYFRFEPWRTPYKKLVGQGQPVWDEQSMSAAAQPFFGKFTSGLVSRGASLVPKVGQNIGHIGGAISFGVDYLSDPETADPSVIWDNGFVNAMSKADEGLREKFPIYRTWQGRNGNLLQQMKDPGFWFDDGFDALAFLGSAYITGAGVGALASASSKAFGLTAQMVQKAKVYGSTVLNSIGEAGFEAKDFQDTERNNLAFNEYGMQYTDLDPASQDKVKSKVSEGAANVFNGNLGVLLVPNYIQSRFMFGRVGKTAEDLRAGVRSGRIASEDINLFKKSLTDAGLAMSTEGPWEEGMQYALQTYNKKKESYGQDLDDYTLGLASEWVDNLFTTEGQKNIVLGSLVGGLFGSIGGYREGLGEKAEIEKEEELYDHLKRNMSGYDKWYVDHVTKPYKKFVNKVEETQPDGSIVEKDVESYYNKNGKTEVDLDAVNRMFMHTVNDKFLYDEAMVATINADDLHLNTINNDALTRLYYWYATDDLMSSLDEVDDLLLQRDLQIPEELAKLGYDKKFTKSDLTPIRKAFENARTQVSDAEDFSGDRTKTQFKQVAMKTLFAEEVKRNMYEEYLSNEKLSDKQKEDVKRLIADSKKLSDNLLNKKTREKLYDEFKLERDQYNNVLKNFEEVNKDSKATSNDKLKAQYDRDEFLYIEGPEDPFSPIYSQSVTNGTKTANVFGARYNYYFDRGKAAYKKAELNNTMEDAAKGKRNLSDIIGTIRSHLSDGIVYSAEEIDKVGNLISKRRESVDRASKQVPERQKRLNTNTEEVWETVDGFPTGNKIPNSNFNPKQRESDQVWLDNYIQKSQDQTDAENSLSEIKNMSEQSGQQFKTDKKQMSSRRKAYRKFQREFADTPVDKAKDLLLSYNGNKDVFDQVDDVDDILRKLEDRKKVYSLPGRKKLLTTSEFKGYIESIDEVLPKLKAIRNKAFENGESRKSLDKRTRLSYSGSLFNAIGISINREKKSYSVYNQDLFNAVSEIIGKTELDNILETAKSAFFNETDYSFDGIFIEKIISRVKDANNGVKRLSDLLKKIEFDKINNFIDVYVKWTKLEEKGITSGVSDDLKAYKKSPFRAFDRLIEIQIDRFRVQTEKISPIDRFFRNKDVFQLLDAVQNNVDLVYPNINKDDFSDLIKAHIEIMGLSRLKDRLTSKITIQEMIGLESAVIKEKKLSPNNQQHITLREAVVEMNSPIEKKEEKFRGWYYIKGLAGCLSGDVLLPFKTKNRVSGRINSVKYAYYKFNNIKVKGISGRPWDKIIPIETLSLLDGYIGYNKIIDIIYSGKKQTYKVTVDSGRNICVTIEHPFKVPKGTIGQSVDGFKKLSELKIGDIVFLRDLKKGTGRDLSKRLRRKIIYGIIYHPNKYTKIVNNKDYGRLPYCRLVVEAKMNNIGVNQFINELKTNSNSSSIYKFLDPKLIVHHKDENPINDDLDNLVIITKQEHDKLHGYNNITNMRFSKIIEEKIISIEKYKYEDTYDIIMQFPYHNYVANDFIVHNTGKTDLMANYLPDLLGISHESLIALSTHENALEVLKKSLPGVKNSMLVSNLTDEMLKDENNKLVIIDEVARLNAEELHTLAERIVSANETRAIPIRIYVLGDPSQVASLDDAFPAINSFRHEMSNIREFNPLTSVFRSGNSSVLHAQNSFLDYPGKIKSFLGTASADIGAPADGVHVSNIQQRLFDQLEVHKKNNNRSRVVVVSNPVLKRQYEKTGVPVMFYHEVASLSYDEVYIDINPVDFEFNRKYNEGMYTALSRARSYIFIKSYMDPDAWKYTIDEIKKENNESRNKEIAQEYTNRLAFELNILGDDMKGVKISTPQIVNIEKGDPSDIASQQSETDAREEEPLSDKNTPTDNATFVEVGSGNTEYHDVEYPSYYPIKPISQSWEEIKMAPVRTGSKVKYIKVWNANVKKYEVHIIGQHLNIDDTPLENDLWSVIGVLSEKELLSTDFGKTLLYKMSAAKTQDGKELSNRLSQGNTGILQIKDGPTILAEGVIQKAQPLSYKYSDDITSSGPGFLSSLISKVKQTFANENLEFSVKIYARNDDRLGNHTPGVPYLDIERKTMRAGKEEGAESQFIRLNARKIRNTDSILQPIIEFRDTVKKLESEGIGTWGDPKTNELIKRFKRNFDVIDDEIVPAKVNRYSYNTYLEERDERGFPILTKEQFDLLYDLSNTLIPAFYGPGRTKKEVIDEDAMWEYLGENKKTDPNTSYEFKEHPKSNGGYILMTNRKNEDEKEYVYDTGLIAGEGIVQKRMNVLARANNKLPFSISHKTNLFRNGKKRVVISSESKSLFAEETSTSEYINYIKTVWKDMQEEAKAIGVELPSYSSFIDKESKRLDDQENIAKIEQVLIDWGNAGSDIQGLSREELNITKEKYVKEPLKISDLNNLLSFDNAGVHKTLTLPLKMSGIYGVNELGKNINSNLEQLEDILGTKLEDIIRTRIQIKLDEPISKEDAKKDSIKKGFENTYDKIQEKIKNRKKRLMRATPGMDLGKELTLSEARSLLAKFIPSITTQGKDVIHFAEKIVIDEIAGDNAYGVFHDEVIWAMEKNGSTFEKIIRHEAFHKIFNEYITKNEQDLIVKSFKKQFPEYKDKGIIEIEEQLAIKFQDYQSKKLSRINEVLKRFFNWLASTFGFINLNLKNFDRFFETIESGYFITTKENSAGITRSMKNIINLYGNDNDDFQGALETYRNARAIIQQEFYDVYEKGFAGYPITRREVKDITIGNLKNDHLIIKDNFDNMIVQQDLAEGEILNIARELRYYGKAIENYDRIIEDLYPNWSLDEADEIVVNMDISTEEILVQYEEDDETDGGISQHTIESDEVNWEVKKQSMAVKDFLSNIPIDNNRFMNWREAYVRTLQLFEGLQPENDRFIDQLRKAWENLGKHHRTEFLLNKIIELHTIASGNIYGERGETLGNNMKFVTEDMFVISDEELVNVYGEAGAMQNGATVDKRRSNESTREFIIRIAKTNNVSEEEIIGHFKKFQAIDSYKSLVNLFNNQKQKNLYIIEKTHTSGGTYAVGYIPGSYIGPHKSIGSLLNENIRNYFPDKRSLEKFVKDWLRPNIEKYKSNPYEFIKVFLKEMGMGSIANSIPNTNVQQIYYDVEGFFTRPGSGAIYRIGEVEEITDEDTGEVMKVPMTIGLLLDEEGKMSGNLSKLMSVSSAYVRATSVRDVKGKRKYIWSPTSWANNILFNIANNKILKTGNLTLSLPQYLTTEYFKKNIFLSGKNKIHDIVDSDGIKFKDYTGKITGIKQSKENEGDFILRGFVAGFLDRIRYSKSGHERYFQFVYPNERENVFGAEVNVLTHAEIRVAISEAIRQFNSEPVLSGIKQNNTGRFINFRLLEKALKGRDIVAKPLSEKEIDKYSQVVESLLSEEAKKLAERVIRNRVPLDKEIFSNKNLEKIVSPDKVDLDSFRNSKHYGRSESRSMKPDGSYNWTMEQILPLTHSFIANNYVNSFFLNQIILGENNQFVNEEDVMRRFSLATAPGSKGLVNKTFGMKEKARFLVIEDQIKGFKDIEARLDAVLKTDEEKAKLPILMEKFKENINIWDGQGFMTPERFEELRNGGFATEFSLHKILKPVVYSVSEEGVARGIKYSSIVLSDELIEEFPSLGILLANMRRNNADEAVFRSAIKIGIPESAAPFESVLSENYAADPSMLFDINNDQYRIQMDPKSKISGKTSQPSQLIYLASVLSQNTKRADRIYYHLSELSRLGNELFFSKFNDERSIKTNITSLLRGKGNENTHDILSSEISINFPSIVDKVIIALSSHLKDSIVEFDFPGSKLVLQSEFGVRKYGLPVSDGPKNKLKYIRTDTGRMVAECIIPEGLLPKEYEDSIKQALAEGKNAEDYFDLPDLLGFRIPSSDIHSAVAIKVVGFYKTPNINVIIAPDLLVGLHGSDFDVDSLFIIKRAKNKRGEYIGYKEKKGRMTFIRNTKDFEDIYEEIGFRKNAVIHELLDLVSNQENIESMLSPIPLKEIMDQKTRVLNPNYRPRENKLDLSNYNDQIDTHSTIFGAAVATGVFGNAAKTLAYMMRTGENQSNPKLRDENNIVRIRDSKGELRIYDELTLFDNTGQSLFVSIDGFINAAIDNIKMLALPTLNINMRTIHAFISLRTLGINLTDTVDILQQPAILDYANGRSFDMIKKQIVEKLSGYEAVESEINPQNISTGIRSGNSIDDYDNAISEDGKKNNKAAKALMFQMHIIETFQNMTNVGNSIGKLAQWLKIARTLPVTKNDIDKIKNVATELFGVIEEDGTLPAFGVSSFPFDISEFFLKSKHILQIYKGVRQFDELLTSSIKKYYPEFEDIVNQAYRQLGKFGLNEVEGKSVIRDELVNYLMSNEIFSGEYKIEKDVSFEYTVGDEKRILTGPKAVNQIFIGKITALKNYINKERTEDGDPISNTFIERLGQSYNSVTKTYELTFEGGSNMDQMDILDARNGFFELNKYEVSWNKKTGKYTVKKNTEPKSNSDYSDLQREFVSYGIMNWGLKFGIMNYSTILPENLYYSVDNLLNKLMDKFTGDKYEENWSKIQDDFMVQLVLNNSEMIPDIFRTLGKPIKKGSFVNEYGQTLPFYGGKTNEYFYDRSYSNPDQKEMPRFIVSSYAGVKRIYLRLNNAIDPIVYYQVVDRSSTIKFYNTSDEVLENGFDINESFKNNGIYNVRVADFNTKEFEYYGSGLKEGDIVSLTQFHDVTRVNKQYCKIIKKLDNSYIIRPVKEAITKHSYDKFTMATEHVIIDLKTRMLKHGTPFRNDNKGRGRILYGKHSTNEAREFKSKINNEEFGGIQVLRERLWYDGIQIYVDVNALHSFFLKANESNIKSYFETNNISDTDQEVIYGSKQFLKNIKEDNITEEIESVQKLYSEEESISTLIDNMILRSKSKRRINLLTTLKDRIVKQGMTIKFGELSGIGRYGEYSVDGSIVLDLVNLYIHNGPIDIDQVDKILFHEMIHGITVTGMLENESFSKDILKLINEYFDVDQTTGQLIVKPFAKKTVDKFLSENGYPQDINSISSMNLLGMKNQFEFIAEILSNDEFAKMIDSLKRSQEERSLLKRILDKIMEFISLAKEFSNDLLQIILNSPHTPSFTKEGILYRSQSGNYYKDTKLGYEVEVEVGIRNDSDTTRKNILDLADNIKENAKKIKVEKLPDGTEGQFYIVEGMAKKIRRITNYAGGFISMFTNKKIDPNITFGQHLADVKWGDRTHDHKLLTEQGNMEDYDQYKDRMELNSKLGQIKGNILHLFLKRTANRLFHLGEKDEDILKEINNVASRGEGKTPIEHYSWIEDPEVLRKVFKHAGVNVLSKDIPEALRDIIYLPEVTIWSDLLGFGGTMDALIGHADGRWSIKDWKSGNAFGIKTTMEPMMYGLQDTYISDNQRERAKLQVMIYAFLLKLQYPDIKFRDLMTVWIPNQFLGEKEDMDRFVEVSSYLNMIKAFLNDREALKNAGIDENVYQKIVEKSPKIFSISEYTDKANDSLFESLVNSKFSPEEEYRKRVDEIRLILGRLKERRQIRIEELPEDTRKRLAQLYEEIAIMRADPSMQLDVSPNEDIGIVTEWLGNYSDVNMGVFQTWVKVRNGEWNKYTMKHEDDLSLVNKYIEPILDKYMKGKIRIRRGGVDRVANINYAELYHFAFIEEEKTGYIRERLVIPTDPQWNTLTEEQKKLLTWLNQKFASWFIGPNAFFNQIATKIEGKELTWLDLFNLDRTANDKMVYYDGWFPKVMKTLEEVNYEEGARILNKQVGRGDIFGANIVGRFSIKNIKERAMRGLTWYVEDTFEAYNDVRMSIPIKYLDNFVINNSKNYTHNLAFMFDAFNKSSLHKQYMEPVFHIGQALKIFLQMKKHGNGQPMFENTVGFLEKKLIGDIQNHVVRKKYTRLPITIGRIADPFTGEKKTFNVDLDKIVEQLINWTSATVMWLKPFQGGGNGLQAKLLTYRDALKGTIASKFAHIDGDAIDFTLSDNTFADKIYFGDFTKDAMFGDLNKNKMWLLSKKLNYLPDNYDYATNRRFLLSTRNLSVSKSSMYFFHSKAEEYVSLTTMVAQLHHLKNPKTGKSLWDSYDVVKDESTGIYDVKWVGGIRGQEKTGKGNVAVYSNITELTTHEIAKLKKVHERMQGGYRKEEAANLEIFVMGKAMIQFKKYFLRLLMNALGSKREEVDLGTYKKMDETRIDPNTGEKIEVYEWLRRSNEGRWRTLINFVLSFINMSGKEYKWSALTTEQKQNLIDAMITINSFGLFYGLYLAMFGDEDDDDTFKKWWFNYLVMNLSQQYNPLDMLQIAQTSTQPVALARMYKSTQGLTNMMVATGNLLIGSDPENSFTQDGELKGWNEVMRSIPYLSSFHDFASKMKGGAITEQWWVDKWENQWK